MAEKMLRSLASSTYRAQLGQNGGFLLMHSVRHFTANSEVDTHGRAYPYVNS